MTIHKLQVKLQNNFDITNYLTSIGIFDMTAVRKIELTNLSESNFLMLVEMKNGGEL